MLLNGVLPELQSLNGGRRCEGAVFSVWRSDITTSLPHKRVPGEVLVNARCSLEQTAKSVPFGQLVRDFEELVPGFRDIALRKSSLLECLEAVKHRQGYDVERDSIDLFINDPGFHHVWKEVLFRGVLHVRSEDAAKKDFFPNVMETRIVDEKIYGVPFDVVPLAMFYSLKAFEEAGLSESDIPKTWDQFLEIAHKLTKGDRFGCLFETAPGYAQTFYWYPFMWQGGGEIATPDGKHSAFASPGTVQALKFWQDAIQQNVAPRNILGSGGWDVIANLASGFCAMQNLGIWGV